MQTFVLLGTSKLRGRSSQNMFPSCSASTETVESEIQVDSRHVCLQHGSLQFSQIRPMFPVNTVDCCVLFEMCTRKSRFSRRCSCICLMVFLRLKLEDIAEPQFLQAFVIPLTKETFRQSREIPLFLQVFHTLCIFKIYRVNAK